MPPGSGTKHQRSLCAATRHMTPPTARFCCTRGCGACHPAPGRRPTGDPPVVTTGATTSRWRCRSPDPPDTNDSVHRPRGVASFATRPPPQPARQRCGGVAPPAARTRRDWSAPMSGRCPAGEAHFAKTGATAPRGRNPTGDTPSATTSAPAPREPRPTGDGPSVTVGASAP